ncbi:hypothetical protein [Seonamhaeicola sp.]|uniref:hypothetical protein n=1 Tax=Seonamhaeicola sp. TaxID=1912245 RepID=UPI0026209283|nr:hypothetical protein [Seonamhaeicola sp.]
MPRSLVYTFIIIICSGLTYAQSKSDSLLLRLESASDKNDYYHILDTLSKEMVRSNHPQQITYLKEFVELALKKEAFDAAASRSRFIIQWYIYRGENKKAFALIDSMLAYKPKFTKPNSEAHLLLKRGGVYFAEFDYVSAIKDYKASIPLFLKSKDSIYMADAYFFTGQAALNANRFVDAVLNYEKAYELYSILNDFSYTVHVGANLVELYYRNGLEEEATKKREGLIALCVERESFGLLVTLYNNYAVYLLRHKQYPESYKALELSREAKEHSGDDINEHYGKINDLIELESLYCLYYLRQNNLEVAKQYLDKAVLLESQLGNKNAKMYLSYFKALYYKKVGDFDKALEIAMAYKNQVTNNRFSYNSIEIEKLLGELYRSFNDFKKADEQMQLYTRLKDSIYNVSAANLLAYHQARFDTRQKEKTMQELKNDNVVISERNKLLWILFFSLTGLAIAVILYIKLKNKRICKKLNSIINQNQNMFTFQLFKKAEEQKVLSEELQKLKNSLDKNAVDNEIKHMENLLSSKILTHSDWECFKHRFTLAYPHFFIKLKSKNYHFTNSEERLLALEHLKLSNEEIANMLGISVRSVITSRYRLRKKIAVPKKLSVLEYLDV